MTGNVVFAEHLDAVAVAFPMSKTGRDNSGNDVPNVVLEDDSAKFILWGKDNLWPQKAWEEIESNDVAPAALDWKKRALISGGLIYGARYMEDGEEKFMQLMLDEVDDFLENSCINSLYLPASAHNIYAYKTFFPKLVFDRKSVIEFKRIKEIYSDDPHFCRMGKQGKRGWITQVFTSGKFKDEPISPDDLKPHPSIDRFGNIERQLREAKTHMYFPMFNRLNGNVAYELPSWYGLKNSKWLELAKHIPIWKASLMSTAANIKYQFIIHPDYWELKYKDSWEKMKEEDRFKKKQAEVKEVLKAITGNDKAGKAHFTEWMMGDNVDGEPLPAWTIKRIENGAKQGGDYIEDSQEADFHIIRAFGVDPTLIGQTPGSKMGSGSGSDKRVAFNHYMLLCKPEQDAICEPLQWAAKFNGWHDLAKKASGRKDARLAFRFKNYHIAKLELGQEVADADDVTSNGDKKTGDAATGN